MKVYADTSVFGGVFDEAFAGPTGQFFAEIAQVTQEALLLQRQYIDSGVVTPKSAEDALHVALATVSRCALIVSWNFKHIVHFDKIPKYNAVNTRNGYGQIGIYSPLEVIDYGGDDA